MFPVFEANYVALAWLDGAAFFDLDRTLLRGASGPVIGEALKEAGVTDRSIPGEQLIYRFYDLFGENRPSMEVTKRAVRFAEGWVREQVQEAGELAADALAGALQPFARPILDEHKKAGRPLVLATTTPYDLVKPLADALGFDDVVATRYGAKDGVYDGTLDGEFVWGPGKLRAIAEWAMENAIDLGESWAYSDSYYDIPMLSAVRHPVVVNPDPRMLVTALAAAVAGGPPRRAGGRAEAAGAQRRAAARAHGAGPTRADPVRAVRHRRRREPPEGGRRHRGRATTAATSTRWRWASRSPSAGGPCASSGRRRCSTRRSSVSWPGRWAGSGSSAAPAPTSRSPRRRSPSRPARWWR